MLSIENTSGSSVRGMKQGTQPGRWTASPQVSCRCCCPVVLKFESQLHTMCYINMCTARFWQQPAQRMKFQYVPFRRMIETIDHAIWNDTKHSSIQHMAIPSSTRLLYIEF
jgi:hypothetical protein